MTQLNTIDIDREISSMRLASKELISMSNKELANIFQECITHIPTYADYWVELEAQNKQVKLDTPEMGEQWAGGPWLTVWGFRYIIKTLSVFPQIDLDIVSKYNKEDHTLQVFPTETIEKLSQQ